jgi:hypothetical protein
LHFCQPDERFAGLALNTKVFGHGTASDDKSTKASEGNQKPTRSAGGQSAPGDGDEEQHSNFWKGQQTIKEKDELIILSHEQQTPGDAKPEQFSVIGADTPSG